MHSATPTLGLVIQWGSSGWTGGPNYLKNLALATAALPASRRLRLVFLVQPEQVPFLEMYRGILPLADHVRPFAPGVSLDDIDVLYPFPGNLETPPRVARVHWIPDFQHCRLPQFFSEETRALRTRTYTPLAAGQDLVVLSSAAALEDFRSFFQVRCPTHVLHFFSSPEPGWLEGDPAAVAARFGLDSPFLMCCNQFWIHKDHTTLFQALMRLRERGIRPQLVCTGATTDHRHPQYFASLQRLLEEHDLTGQVRILGLIDRMDQIQLLRAAQAVVQPSLFEGWSTVIEDCRLLGKSVVYSNIPVHLEQAPPHGIPFQAGDPDDLARVLEAHLEDVAATAGTAAEQEALRACEDNRLRFGVEITRMVQQAMDLQASRGLPPAAVQTPPAPQQATADVVGRNCFRVKGRQWYAPPLAGASTLAAPLFDLQTYADTLEVLKQLEDDEYLVFLRGFLARGMKRFGAHWKYADLCTVLLTLSGALAVDDYLEIGVRQGRSMAMVVSQRPQVRIAAFDLWREGYAGMDNPGPDFVRAQMARLGHTGELEFTNGNSHETLPRYFAEHPQRSFDLITVDGDHTPEGAAADLREVLPRLRIGGALVFDDIIHPKHVELLQVWKDVVLSRSDMTGFAFTETGYGVAFAVRMR